MWKLLTKRTSLHSSFFRDLKLPVKIDDVRSGTMDMVPLVPRLLSLPPSRKEEEREPWARGCPHKSARCEPIRTFAPSLVLQNIYAIITKSYKKSFLVGKHFVHCGLESGMVFEGTTGANRNGRIYRFNSK